MQKVREVAQTRVAIAALSALLSVLGTAMMTHYPHIYAAVCAGGGEMVAPAVAAAGIGAIGNLLGGLFGRNSERKAIAAQNAYNDPAAVRQRFERAGFNPLLGIQPGVGMQAATGGTNFIGSAIADSASAMAQAWSKTAQDKAEAQAVKAENEKLQRKLVVETIRPKVGGLYGRPSGEKITISGPKNGWVSEYDADWVGSQAKRPDENGLYESRLPEKTVVRTPFGEITPSSASDAEAYEKRYGDVVSWAAGMATLAADAGTTLRKYTDAKGWTTPGKWVGQETVESFFNGKKDKVGIPKPSGYTEAGNPFWVQPDGSIKWKYEK